MTMGRRSGAGSGRRVETVLVPLDGSKLAEGALAHVVSLLGGSKLRLVLLQVVPSVNPAPLVAVSVPAPLHASAARRARGERYMEGVRRRLARRRITARVLVRAGDPAKEILDRAHVEDADMIAMTTHGRSGLRRVLFGSVAEAVLRRTRVPILLVRARRGH